jgi:hypothetical protein
MLNRATIELRKLMRKTLVSTLMLAVVGLAFASKGGGGEKKAANTSLKTNFTPIRTTSGFTLKTGPSFSGSVLLGAEKKDNYVSFNTLITYEKGNTMYIMPYRYKVNSSLFLHNSSNSSLQLLDLHINMSRK